MNDQDGIGRTALTYAVHFDHPQAVNTLLEQRADVNLTAHGKFLNITLKDNVTKNKIYVFRNKVDVILRMVILNITFI